MATPGRGVGALDPVATAELRDALLAAASEVHADAGSVLSSAPDAKDAAPLGWLRPSPGADGGDLETHVAVALFWGLFRAERRAAKARRQAAADDDVRSPSRDPSVGGGVGARPRDASSSAPTAVTVVSAYGLERRLVPLELAAALADAIPPDARRRLLVDARPAPGDSGVIHLTTRAVYEARRAAGSLRCAACGRFLPGDRALWWHQKTKHGLHHSEAVDAVADERMALSANAWTPPSFDDDADADADADADLRAPAASSVGLRRTKDADDLARGLAAARAGDRGVLDALVKAGKVEALSDPGLEAARRGDVERLRAMTSRGWDPSAAVDRHGASALLWAAGAGHLDAVKYLVEEAGIDPATTAQVGRRAYHGRTAAHWAARNGRTDVVAYLIGERGAPVDARTAEGTTAFAWACWQGHVATARWLVERGNCAFGAVNTFGCNAAMWCVQGRAAGLDACEYVKSLGVSFRLLNANGHSAAHKAAQRGRRDVCAWLLGWEWPEGRETPSPRDAADPAPGRGPEIARRDPLARALVDAAHLGPDDEGFRPSDLARLAGDLELRDFLEARQRQADAADAADAETDRADETSTRAFVGRDGESERRAALRATLEYVHPPATFYAAAASGDVGLLRACVVGDVYRACQDNGAGAPIHFAAARGRADAAAAMLSGALGARVRVNQKSRAGGFELTPLHVAATLFRRRDAAAAARADLEAAEADLAAADAAEADAAENQRGDGDGRVPAGAGLVPDPVNATDAVKRRESKAARKAALKATRKDAHRRVAEARRRLEGACVGGDAATRTYRVLLQHGADPNAVARVPAWAVAEYDGIGTGGGIRTGADASSALVDARPRDLAGRAAAAEIAALEAETAESPPARAPHPRVGDWAFHVALDRDPERRDDSSSERVNGRGVWRPPSSPPFDLADAEAIDAVFRAGAEEAAADRSEATREDVPGVPGAFIVRRAMGARACAALASAVDAMQPRSVGSEPGSKPDSKPVSEPGSRAPSLDVPAPRRESAASRARRDGDVDATFRAATMDPMSLVSATDGVDGSPYAPVEPVRWEVPRLALAALAARLRPHLPEHDGAGANAIGAKRHEHASPRPSDAVRRVPGALARPGFELSPGLRCYRYLPGSVSVPHYDKPSADEDASTASAYSAVVYLNGDDHEGGATTFFEPIEETETESVEDEGEETRERRVAASSDFSRDERRRRKSSRRGVTWAVGGGAAPTFRVAARVRGNAGDVLVFPHGSRPGSHPNPLHEGSPVFGQTPKYIIRTDVHFEARGRGGGGGGGGGGGHRGERARA